MDFGHLEQRRVPLTERIGSGNRRRTHHWDQRGLAADLAESDADLRDMGLGRGGRTRSGPRRPTSGEKRQIKAMEGKEKELAEARKKGLPKNRIKAIERAANNAAKKVPRELGGKRR